jgi:hypothetical protein
VHGVVVQLNNTPVVDSAVRAEESAQLGELKAVFAASLVVFQLESAALLLMSAAKQWRENLQSWVTILYA